MHIRLIFMQIEHNIECFLSEITKSILTRIFNNYIFNLSNLNLTYLFVELIL